MVEVELSRAAAAAPSRFRHDRLIAWAVLPAAALGSLGGSLLQQPGAPVFHYLAMVSGFFLPAVASAGRRSALPIALLGLAVCALAVARNALPFEIPLAVAQGCIGIQLALWAWPRWSRASFHQRLWGAAAAAAWALSSVCFSINTSLELQTGSAHPTWLGLGRALLLQGMPLAIAIAAAPGALHLSAPPPRALTALAALLWIPTYLPKGAASWELGAAVRAVMALWVLSSCGFSVFPPGSSPLRLGQRAAARALWLVAWLGVLTHGAMMLYPQLRIVALHTLFIFTLVGGLLIGTGRPPPARVVHAVLALLGCAWAARIVLWIRPEHLGWTAVAAVFLAAASAVRFGALRRFNAQGA